MLTVAAKVENCFTRVSENSFEISRWMIGKEGANLMPPRSYHANLRQEDLVHTKGNVLRRCICLLCVRASIRRTIRGAWKVFGPVPISPWARSSGKSGRKRSMLLQKINKHFSVAFKVHSGQFSSKVFRIRPYFYSVKRTKTGEIGVFLPGAVIHLTCLKLVT